MGTMVLLLQKTLLLLLQRERRSSCVRSGTKADDDEQPCQKMLAGWSRIPGQIRMLKFHRCGCCGCWHFWLPAKNERCLPATTLARMDHEIGRKDGGCGWNVVLGTRGKKVGVSDRDAACSELT